MTFQLTATEPDAEAKGFQRRTTFKNGIIDGRNKKTVSSARLGDDQTWARLALQQEKEVRNPPREDRPRNSRGYAARALEQSRWRNNSSPGPESEDPCSPLLLRVKVQPPSQRHPGILNGGKIVSSRGYSGHVERTITCHVQLLQPTPKERTTTNIERTYPKDVIITININGCAANLNSKVTQDIH